MDLLRTKPTEQILAESQATEGGLKKTLSALDLSALGVGAMIGAGIFVLTGVVAATKAGPAVSLSFLIAGLACIFSALCYAEFASMLPIAGSAYTYAYATVGELFAWIIGWDLILEYAIGSGAVSVSWSGYLHSLFRDLGINFPAWLASSPFDYADFIEKYGLQNASPPPEIMGIPIIFNLLAALIIMALTSVLVIGIRESAKTNAGVVLLKLAVILFVIVLGALHVNTANWANFFPFGPMGAVYGASVVFFAYIGFDAVSTAAEETKNPQRDLPIGIISSLLVCSLLYVAVSLILTGLVPFDQLDLKAPISVAFSDIGLSWASIIISIGAIAGLTSVMLVMLMSQPRIFFAMARDGLMFSWFKHVHPKFKTPANGTIITGLFVALIATFGPMEFLAEMVAVGTLFAFALVCIAVLVMRAKAPDLPRSFKVPWVPVVPLLGIAANMGLMYFLGWETWLRLLIWLGIGLVIYFTYSYRNSRLNKT